MNTSPEKYVERLLAVFDKKHALLLEMLAITRRQSQSINEDGLESLEKAIGEKQSIIDSIDKLDEEFDVYYKRLKQELRVKSLDELENPDIKGLKELKSLTGRVMELIREINRLEKENSTRAKELLENLAGEVRKLNQAKKVNTAYKPGSAMQPPSYYIDKKK